MRHTVAVLPWRAAMASWMAQRLEEGGSLSPDVMLQDVAEHVQATSHADVSSHATADALEASKKRMLKSLLARGKATSNAEEAQQGLEAAWVLSSWVSNPLWRTRSPEQVQAMLVAWPAFLEKDLAAMRVQWAQEATSEGEALRENLVEIPAQEAANVEEVPGASQVMASATDAEETQLVSSASKAMDSNRLSTGAKGVHMGWFRNNPQVQSLPKGTMLDAQAGANGLKRWVLVLPEQASSSEVQSIETWLMQQGIVDAYEVYRDVDGWSTTMPFSEDVVANAVQTSNATPPSAPIGCNDERRLREQGRRPTFGRLDEMQTSKASQATGPRPRNTPLAMALSFPPHPSLCATPFLPIAARLEASKHVPTNTILPPASFPHRQARPSAECPRPSFGRRATRWLRTAFAKRHRCHPNSATPPSCDVPTPIALHRRLAWLLP